MRVRIEKYKDYFGPFQLAEKILFWMDKDDDRVFKFGNWLAHGKYVDIDDLTKEVENHNTVLAKILYWVRKKKKRKIKVQIDPWDTWSMNTTLSHIIIPMLKQLKENKNGSPWVDPEDVPENMQPSEEEVKQYNHDGTADDNFHKRWDYILDEMIFAFEHIKDEEWKNEFYSGESDMEWVKKEETYFNPITQKEEALYEVKSGPKDTFKIDFEGMKKVEDRIDNGLRLFGKYYRALWS